MAEIHPTAIIDSTAEIADDVKIGPYCIIGGHVKLGSGCVLHSHVVLGGPSTFGKNNEFFPFAVIGLKTQDLKYKGEPTYLEVGDNNVFRENCNINRGTTAETKTVIGNNNLFLINSHCGHEVHVGNNVIMSGFAAAAGHCTIGDWAIIGGCAGLHQFVRIGEHAMVGGACRVVQDVAPYMIADSGQLRSVNTIGLQRRGFDEGDIRAIKYAYRKLFLDKKSNMTLNIESLMNEGEEKYVQNPHVQRILEFLKTSERGFLH
ncbi:MAG: acyl-ACP--UDP-N-acetylglucosamine O-acyltransferase [Akkermansia sp.]|nr:acyl-ACP--UDP-N-acetylglucosamine O-acyltransferase [Akkermansia sp.]